MQKLIRHIDKLFSLFVFASIVLLAVYMTVRIGAGAYHFFGNIFSGALFMDEQLLNEANRQALLSIAEVLILMKAYRILVSYLTSHHISVEYIVEISIIAPAIELLFAYDAYDVPTKIILGVFGLANLFFYLHYFGPEHDESLHRSVRKHK